MSTILASTACAAYPPLLAPAKVALLLDIDGTLLEFRGVPSSVRADESLIAMLCQLAAATEGALALVSGRPLDDIDRIFQPAIFSASGAHGAELRIAGARLSSNAAVFPNDARAAIQALARQNSAWLLEEKPFGAAIHYRRAPESGSFLRQQVQEIAERIGPSFRVQTGHLVVEITPAAFDKGKAIHHVMHHHLFAGRRPIYLGDDACDEPGFAAVNALGGESILVGANLTGSCARFQLSAPSDVRVWLQALMELSHAPA